MKSKNIVNAVPALPLTDACIRQTVNTIKNSLKYKYHNTLHEAGFDFEGAADIAVCYALTPGLTGRGPFPKSPNDLQALAWTKAKWLANDEIRRLRRAIVTGMLDEPYVDSEGHESTGENHPVAAQAAAELYDARVDDAERFQMGRRALGRLSRFLSAAGFSDRDISAYRDYQLYAKDSDRTAEKHGISKTNLYVICHRINLFLELKGLVLTRD